MVMFYKSKKFAQFWRFFHKPNNKVFKNMRKLEFLSFQISSFSDLDIDLNILIILFYIATANWSFACYARASDYLIIFIHSKIVPKTWNPSFFKF